MRDVPTSEETRKYLARTQRHADELVSLWNAEIERFNQLPSRATSLIEHRDVAIRHFRMREAFVADLSGR